MFKKIKKTIESIILCIRFPFLYPRNRFTDLHYTNWKLRDFHTKWYKYTEDCFFVSFTKESKSLYGFYKIDDRTYSMQISKSGMITITLKVDSDKLPKVLFKDFITNYMTGTHLNYGWTKEGVPTIVMSSKSERTNGAIVIKYLHAPLLRKLINIVDWIHENPVQWLHCIPTYTELDAMDTGWRKAFGIQICKEIRAEIRKHPGMMKKYRIMQIKEKYGTLRWYDAYTTKEIQAIIAKYENLSYHTCINCGKPATKISTGWICPYCDDCIGNRNYTEIYKEANSEEIGEGNNA